MNVTGLTHRAIRSWSRRCTSLDRPKERNRMAVRVSHVELATPRLILGRTLNRGALGFQLSMERVRIDHVEKQEGTCARRVRVPASRNSFVPPSVALTMPSTGPSVQVRAQQLVGTPAIARSRSLPSKCRGAGSRRRALYSCRSPSSESVRRLPRVACRGGGRVSRSRDRTAPRDRAGRSRLDQAHGRERVCRVAAPPGWSRTVARQPP